MKRPTTAGAACRRAQRPATPAHAQGPRRQLPNQGVAKNGELLGPKVKGQMGYSKANLWSYWRGVDEYFLAPKIQNANGRLELAVKG